jgi:transposase InsO family protein
MPWKEHTVVRERLRLVEALLQGQKPVSQWCRTFGVSRRTAYKWKARFLEEGRRGLEDRPRRPHGMPRRWPDKWSRRIRRIHRRHPSWGPKKLRAWFVQQGGRSPCARTIARRMKQMGLSRVARRRPRKAGVRVHRRLTTAHRPHQVWTVDFKGWFRTGNGERVEPLTVRDLFSRYVLLVRLLPDQRWLRVRAVFTALFRRQGLPEAIRVDNGGPFASSGPAGLSRLSAWWVRLGIRVEFTRPAHPQDNGSHEQFHRVLKRETIRPPAETRRGQQQRTTVWVRGYNCFRPHEALGQKPPVRFHRKNRRRLPARTPRQQYPEGYRERQVRSNGEVRWKGRRRFIGEAFVGQTVGLKPRRRGVHGVYFAHLFIGHLHDDDPGAMRPALYRHRRATARKRKV